MKHVQFVNNLIMHLIIMLIMQKQSVGEESKSAICAM